VKLVNTIWRIDKSLSFASLDYYRFKKGGCLRAVPCSLPILPCVSIFPHFFVICSLCNLFSYHLLPLSKSTFSFSPVPYVIFPLFACSPKSLADHQKAFCLLWKCTELSRCFKTSHCNNLKLSRVNKTNWLLTDPRKVNKPVDRVIWTRQGSFAYLTLSTLESFPCYIYSQWQLLAFVFDGQWGREVSRDENIAFPTLQLNTKIVIMQPQL